MYVLMMYPAMLSFIRLSWCWCLRYGHYEYSPYDRGGKISCYHVREFEVYKLAQVQGNIDIFISHDWPRGVYHHGNMQKLLRDKQYFRQVRVTTSVSIIGGNNPALLILNGSVVQLLFDTCALIS